MATINKGIIDSTCSNLQPNSIIYLGYTDEGCSTTYVVQPDDTCDAITQTVGINSMSITYRSTRTALTFMLTKYTKPRYSDGQMELTFIRSFVLPRLSNTLSFQKLSSPEQTSLGVTSSELLVPLKNAHTC